MRVHAIHETTVGAVVHLRIPIGTEVWHQILEWGAAFDDGQGDWHDVPHGAIAAQVQGNQNACAADYGDKYGDNDEVQLVYIRELDRTVGESETRTSVS